MHFYRLSFFDDEANRHRYYVDYASLEEKPDDELEQILLTCVKNTDRMNWNEKYSIVTPELSEAEIDKYPIREDYRDYYNFLERLRDSGATNMFGAGPYLESAFHLSINAANSILANWMHNYDELNNLLGWGR